MRDECDGMIKSLQSYSSVVVEQERFTLLANLDYLGNFLDHFQLYTSATINGVGTHEPI